MAKNYAKYIYRTLKKLAKYIKYLAKLSKKYKTAVRILRYRNNLAKIIKAERTIIYENKIIDCFDRAVDYYKELKHISENYYLGINVDLEINWFIERLNAEKFYLFKNITLKLVNSTLYFYLGTPPKITSTVLNGSISKSNLDIEKEEFEKSVRIWEDKIKKNIDHPILGRLYASKIPFRQADAVGMINIASGKYLPLYTKDAIKIKNVFDKKLDKFNNGDLLNYKLHMADKTSRQFEDFNYDLEDVNGYIFKNNSAVVKRIKNSEDFKNILLKHKEQIANNKNFSGRFETDYNLHNAFGSVDFFNLGLDKKGNLHLYMFDTYDFNKGENSKVEAGRRQMLKGNLKGFFTIHEIIIKKKDLKKYGL